MTTAIYPIPGASRDVEISKQDFWQQLVAQYNKTSARVRNCQVDLLGGRHEEQKFSHRQCVDYNSAQNAYAAEIAYRQAARAILDFNPEETTTCDWLLTVVEIAKQYMPSDCLQSEKQSVPHLVLSTQLTKILAWLDIGACFDLHGDFPEGYEIELVDAVNRIDEQLVNPDLGPLRRNALQTLSRHYLSELRVEFCEPANFDKPPISSRERDVQEDKRQQFLKLYGDKYLDR